MDWLKDYSYLAAWLALPVAILAAIVQNKGKSFAEVDWSRLLIYITFLVALGVAFTPTFDETSRSVAKSLLFMGIGFLIVDRKIR